MDTPIGQFLLIGNFRRRLARELLVIFKIFKIFIIIIDLIATGSRECQIFIIFINLEARNL